MNYAFEYESHRRVLCDKHMSEVQHADYLETCDTKDPCELCKKTHVEINVNSHVGAMCETTKPILCETHLAEVRNDGDLLQVYGESDNPCTMCAAEGKS